MTPKVREDCLKFKKKALEIEHRFERDRLFKQCMEDLEQLEAQTKDLTLQSTLENQLAFENSPSHVPSKTYNKLKNLTCETFDVTEYNSDGGVKMIETPPRLFRSNSYTLENPSPVLLAHIEKEAKKCMEIDDDPSECSSEVTVVDSAPVLHAPEIEPQFQAVLDSLPEEHAKNILEILTRQQEEQRRNRESLDEKSMSMSISSQSLYYSFVNSPVTPSPNLEENLNVVNLKNSKNLIDRDKAASIIGAAVKGYLVRRLIRTEKVQTLIQTIKDAVLCAMDLHKSDVIEESDVELHRRLIQQLSATCYAFHDVFFLLSIKEQMELIASDRQRKREKAKRPQSTPRNQRKSR